MPRFGVDRFQAVDGSISAPAYTWLNDTDTGFYRQGANAFGAVSNGLEQFRITDGGFAFQKSTIVSAAVGTLTINAFTLGGAITGNAQNISGLGTIAGVSLATSAAIPLLLTNGQLVNIALTSQTIGATTLTIPDFASVVDEFTFKTKAQTMANKTLTSPTINGVTALEDTSSSITGVITKGGGGVRFIHNFALAGTDGFNTFVGVNAGNFTMTGSIGSQGSHNTAVGYTALYANTTGSYNTAVGRTALPSNTTGNYNTGVGYIALYDNTTGSYNTAVGYSAFYSNTTGDYNTAVGWGAGYNSGVVLQTNSNCVFVGYNANTSVNALINVIVIGSTAQGTKSNLVVLGNSSITETWLRGNVGIGTEAPGTKLTVRQASDAYDQGISVINAGNTRGLYIWQNGDTTRLDVGSSGNYNFVINGAGTGNVGIGTITPTAILHLKAGTATANTAPLKFNSGTLLTAAEAGAIEFLTDAFYATITTTAARKRILLSNGINFGPAAVASITVVDGQITAIS